MFIINMAFLNVIQVYQTVKKKGRNGNGSYVIVVTWPSRNEILRL